MVLLSKLTQVSVWNDCCRNTLHLLLALWKWADKAYYNKNWRGSGGGSSGVVQKCRHVAPEGLWQAWKVQSTTGQRLKHWNKGGGRRKKNYRKSRMPVVVGGSSPARGWCTFSWLGVASFAARCWQPSQISSGCGSRASGQRKPCRR